MEFAQLSVHTHSRALTHVHALAMNYTRSGYGDFSLRSVIGTRCTGIIIGKYRGIYLFINILFAKHVFDRGRTRDEKRIRKKIYFGGYLARALHSTCALLFRGANARYYIPCNIYVCYMYMTNVRVLLVIKDIRRWGERVFVGLWSFNGKNKNIKHKSGDFILMKNKTSVTHTLTHRVVKTVCLWETAAVLFVHSVFFFTLFMVIIIFFFRPIQIVC